MSYYLFQGAYTAAAWQSLIQHPADRFAAIQPGLEQLGGSIKEAWFAIGDYDFLMIVQMPDNVCAQAFDWAVTAAGTLRATKLTPLMDVEDGLAAMRKAAAPKRQTEPKTHLKRKTGPVRRLTTPVPNGATLPSLPMLAASPSSPAPVLIEKAAA